MCSNSGGYESPGFGSRLRSLPTSTTSETIECFLLMSMQTKLMLKVGGASESTSSTSSASSPSSPLLLMLRCLLSMPEQFRLLNICKGYAYSGGRKVIRVEVSLDGGET